MWYRKAFQASEFWNLDKLNDPESLDGAFLGVITDSEERTNDPYKIYKNLIAYKNKLLKENDNFFQINDSFENAVNELKSKYYNFDESMSSESEEDFEDSGDWIERAKSWIGTPYKFGGDSRKGIDCSAFVQKVFPELNLPRVASDQQNIGDEISIEDIQPGDRIYFDLTPRKGRGQGVADHVGIYLGNDNFIQASSSKGRVDISTLSNLKDSIVSIRR